MAYAFATVAQTEEAVGAELVAGAKRRQLEAESLPVLETNTFAAELFAPPLPLPEPLQAAVERLMVVVEVRLPAASRAATPSVYVVPHTSPLKT